MALWSTQHTRTCTRAPAPAHTHHFRLPFDTCECTHATLAHAERTHTHGMHTRIVHAWSKSPAVGLGQWASTMPPTQPPPSPSPSTSPSSAPLTWCPFHCWMPCCCAPSGTFIQPWWVFWVHIPLPSWCAHLSLLRLAALSPVSLSRRHHYAFCWIAQLNWK